MAGRGQIRRRKLFAVALVAAFLGGAVTSASAQGAEGCALVADEHNSSRKTLRCGADLTVRAAPGARYHLLFHRGQRLPAGARLDDGALLIEFHPSPRQSDFQILTPLAIAAVRGTRWATEVNSARTSVLTLDGAVAVTNRRLNEYVVLTAGQGVDITAGDTSMVQKQWGQARIRALLSRFGE